VAALGGQSLGVAATSTRPDDAAELIRFLTGRSSQRALLPPAAPLTASRTPPAPPPTRPPGTTTARSARAPSRRPLQPLRGGAPATPPSCGAPCARPAPGPLRPTTSLSPD
jgi:multiple sugar transport system substrate-binding protein